MKEKQMKKEDPTFYKRADEHIRLSNSQVNEEIGRGMVSASFLYSAARFNAYVSASSFNSSKELIEAKEATMKFFMEEYKKMLEENIDDSTASKSRSKIADLRREAILLRRYIAPQRDALNTLALQNVDYITPDDRLRIRDAADQTTRITEELEAIRERCAIVKDQLTDMRAEEMNRNMMILSVVAAVFLPLGLISGMFGINVGGMPWTESVNGFWIVTAAVIVIGIIQLIIFKILKWI